MPLSAAAVKTAEKPYKLFDEKGLFLLVNPTGGKLWRVKYRFAGKESALALGVFPGVFLAAARAKRDDVRTMLADGIDPAAIGPLQAAPLPPLCWCAPTFKMGTYRLKHWQPSPC